MADSKTTAKSSSTTLPKDVFGLKVENNELVKKAYQAYLDNSRKNLAVTKTRGLVRGGGRKPWRQKGTGRARVGSIRSPLWRTGGIIFGPTGNENYTTTIPKNQKKLAIRQALSIANKAKKVSIIPSFKLKEPKTKLAVAALKDVNLSRRVLLVLDNKDQTTDKATRNIPNLKAIQATYLNVYDVINADSIIIVKPALEIISAWLLSERSSDA